MIVHNYMVTNVTHFLPSPTSLTCTIGLKVWPLKQWLPEPALCTLCAVEVQTNTARPPESPPTPPNDLMAMLM